MPNIEDLAAFDPNTMEFPSWFSKYELFIRLAFSSGRQSSLKWTMALQLRAGSLRSFAANRKEAGISADPF